MLHRKSEGKKDLVEKYVKEIEEQFGRESITVVQKKTNDKLTKPVIVKGSVMVILSKLSESV